MALAYHAGAFACFHGRTGGAATRMKYSTGSSIKTGYVKVSELHSVYYETFGNPSGQPAVFLHGGPGAGCSSRHAQFFNPAHYHVVLFDQRGCGKSTPRGCLKENTTWDLVDDLEKLRKHLTIDRYFVYFLEQLMFCVVSCRWLVLGGSWGVTLGLAYAEAYPGAVSALILRGVCLFRQQEIDWIYKQGANLIFPFAWRNFVSVLETDEKADVLTSFYKRLTSVDPTIQLAAARAWFSWEITLSSFSSTDQSLLWDGKKYSNASGQIVMESQRSKKPGTGTDTQFSWNTFGGSGMPAQLVQARLECHYAMRNGFLTPNQLLEGVRKIKHIPCVMVHGRFDFVCPLANAVDLHQAWPEAELRIVGGAGHSMYEKGISEELIRATDALINLKA